MNLVVDCMQVFASRPLSYFREGEKTLLIRRFRDALKNPALKRCRKDLGPILEFIEEKNAERELWKDCELYYPVDYLFRSAEEGYFPYMVLLLKLLLGIENIRDAAPALPDGFYRLKHSIGAVYEVSGGRLRKLPRDMLWKAGGFASDFYLPRDGLFSDIMNEKLYPAMKRTYEVRPVKEGVAKTLANIEGFSEDVYRDFQDSISNVVLLTKTPKLGTSSLTMRYKYFGGVFFNPFMNDEHKGVEALMHEYIHNRCWLWWEMHPPTGVPSEKVKIVSPVTGNKVRVSAMIQAYIIYVGALQYYRHTQSRGLDPSVAAVSRMNRRASHIARALPVLHRRLRRSVAKKTDIARLFDYLREVYRPLEEPVRKKRA